MGDDWRRRLGTGLGLVAVVEALLIVGISNAGDPRFVLSLDLTSFGFLASIVLFPVVGALILQRRPRTLVPWLMSLLGVGIGTTLVLYGYAVLGTEPGRKLPLAIQAEVLSLLLLLPSIALGGALILLYFPTDSLLTPRWRPVVPLALLGAAMYDVGTLFHAGELNPESFPGVPNPLGTPESLAWLPTGLTTAGNAVTAVAVLLAAASVIPRYRRAEPAAAAQIRWLALVGGVGVVFLALSAVGLDGPNNISFGVGIATLALMPVAIGIAITRYRLYDIDRLINRALVYGSLTAILAGVFTAAMGLAQRLFVAVTGTTSDAAIILTTLVVATLYAPLRKRLEGLVDRRFKYEQRRFGPYADDVRRVLAVIDPERAAVKLAHEIAEELGATGVAVLGSGGRVLAIAGTAPERNDRTVVEVPPDWTVAIGQRRDARVYAPAAIRDVQEMARLVRAAVREPSSEALDRSDSRRAVPAVPPVPVVPAGPRGEVS